MKFNLVKVLGWFMLAYLPQIMIHFQSCIWKGFVCQRGIFRVWHWLFPQILSWSLPAVSVMTGLGFISQVFLLVFHFCRSKSGARRECWNRRISPQGFDSYEMETIQGHLVHRTLLVSQHLALGSLLAFLQNQSLGIFIVFFLHRISTECIYTGHGTKKNYKDVKY